MKFLLDTDICIYVLNGGDATLEKKFRSHAQSPLFVSALTEAELRYGALHSKRPQKNAERIDQFLAPLSCLPFDAKAAKQFALIKQYLVAKGRPIGVMDMLIAAVAKSQDLTLVSNNTKHFKMVPGLVLENWAAG